MRAGSYLPTQRGTSSASLRTAAPDPPPSGHDHARNPHRLGVAWSKSAVRAILGNPRYTGYQVWNKQRRHDLRETDLVPKLDTWLARLVSPANIETTCRRLAAAHAPPAASDDVGLRAAQQALADRQRKLTRHRAALEAGGDPQVINQWIAETTQQQRQAQRTLHQLQAASTSRQPVDPAVVRALLAELGDLAAGLDLADPEQRALFYEEMGISGLYQPANRIVLITAEPDMRRRTVRVGGGT